MKKSFLTLIMISTALCFSCDPKHSSGIYPTAPIGESDPTSISFTTDADQVKHSTVAPIDFNIKGVKLGDGEKSILQRLGKPLTYENNLVNECGYKEKGRTMLYKGMTLQLEFDSRDNSYAAVEIIVSGSNISIEPGIKIGDPMDQIKQKLGDAQTEVKAAEETTLAYPTPSLDPLELVFQNERLITATFSVNPC